ncbi:MAG: hypothetical protein Q7T29_03860 [Gallionella sp.]|nr:hypothetical protein [Gallionella sp.]
MGYLVSMGAFALVRHNPGFAVLGFLAKNFLSIHALKQENWMEIHYVVEFWGSIVVVSRLFC